MKKTKTPQTPQLQEPDTQSKRRLSLPKVAYSAFLCVMMSMIFCQPAYAATDVWTKAKEVRGIDSKTRSVVASRKEAMLRKRQIFYLDTDAAGMYRVYEGRIVQARVIAVAEKVVRVEVFGVETSILARDLAWDWIGDAHERFSVGDEVLVRILSVRRNSLEDLGIKADIKSISENTDRDNLQKCRIQGKYAGRVTDVHKGVVYVRLSNGVNAVAHSCYDYRMPGKKDDVSFAVTRLDMERGVAVGIITWIIRQNL